ncbi:MAG TPA: hypothetical protein DDZ88_09635 [Verrucomicrobiales bacterium]|nr:hypothetical protein [Verrucomicrobiales bacterium]
MKSLLLALALLPCVVFAEADSIADFQALVAKFPKTAPPLSPGQTVTVTVTSSDVRKTDSLITPILGTIDYKMTISSTVSIEMLVRAELVWKNNAWKLYRILRTDKDPAVDVTKEAQGGVQLDLLKEFYAPLQ